MKEYLDKSLGMILLALLCNGVAAQTEAEKTAADSQRTGILSGRVIDENGQPFPNIPVFINSRDWNAPSYTATTDREGRFQVSGLDPALYSVAARAPTYVLSRYDLIGQPSYYRVGDSITMTLVKGGVITGTVSSASGEPLVQIGVNAILLQEVDGQKYAFNGGAAFTDDLGVYRIYGLQPGTYLVTAGGRDSFRSFGYSTAYDSDTPTYSPSSTRDTAVEVIVRSGEETSGVDIRHRAELGHVVSGTVKFRDPNSTYASANVTLTQVSNSINFAGVGSQQASQFPGSRGFSFPNVADGDYVVTAMSAVESGLKEVALSERKRITVKGADVTGIDLVTSPLGSIGGRLVLENSNAPSCKDKRKPIFAETLISAKNSLRESTRDELQRQLGYLSRVVPDKSGEFSFRYLIPGRYGFDLQFFAKYWYLQAITVLIPTAETIPGKSKSTTKPVDAASNWVSLKSGEHLTGLSIRIAEGAASLQGKIITTEDRKLSEKLIVHLVPTEADKVDEVLRFYAVRVKEDGSFTIDNIAPGRYWAVAHVLSDDSLDHLNLRRPDQTEVRRKLRREAETSNRLIELTACQNLVDVKLKM